MEFTWPSPEECQKLLAVAELRAREVLHNEHDAEEAANTALKQLLTEIEHGRGPRNRAGWITTCARRRAVDIRRRRGPEWRQARRQDDLEESWDDLEIEDLNTPLRKLLAKEDQKIIGLVMRCARSMFEPEEQEIFEGLIGGRTQASLAYEIGAHDAVTQRVNAAIPEVAACALRFITHTKPAPDSQLYVVSCMETLNELAADRLRALVNEAIWAAGGTDPVYGFEEEAHQLTVSHYLEWTLKDLGGRGRPSRSTLGQRRLLAGAAICVSHSLSGGAPGMWISDEIDSFDPMGRDDLFVLLHAMRRSMNLKVADPLGGLTPQPRLEDFYKDR